MATTTQPKVTTTKDSRTGLISAKVTPVKSESATSAGPAKTEALNPNDAVADREGGFKAAEQTAKTELPAGFSQASYDKAVELGVDPATVEGTGAEKDGVKNVLVGDVEKAAEDAK